MIENLLRAEVLAARIEGICRADPALGRLWRAEGAMAEAVATVGLEGVRIEAWDLLPRIAFNGGLAFEPGYAETMDLEQALRALRILKSPGDPFRDPIGSLRRIESLGRAHGFADALAMDDGVQISPEEVRPPRKPLVPDEEVLSLLAAPHPADPPILAALRVASSYRLAAPGGEPMVERALFVMVEGALRTASTEGQWKGRGLASKVSQSEDEEDEPVLRGLSDGVIGGWVALPSIALTRGTFHLWDPGSTKGVRDLLQGLVTSLSHELGRVIPLRGWLEAVEDLAKGRRAHSRLLDAARLFIERPVMTASDMAQHLSITPRGATNLAVQLADQGLLGEITHRRYARIWATPELARLLAPRAVNQRLRRVQELSKPRPEATDGAGGSDTSPPMADAGGVAQDWGERKARSEVRLERIYEGLDAALAQLDGLMVGPANAD